MIYCRFFFLEGCISPLDFSFLRLKGGGGKGDVVEGFGRAMMEIKRERGRRGDVHEAWLLTCAFFFREVRWGDGGKRE